jgi:hypothetical protein
MKKKFLLSFFVFILFLGVNKVNAYEEDEIICYDKLIMNFDRNEYVSGEKIFFKINCINSTNHKIPSESQFVYVELINPAGYSVGRKKINLEMGSGFGAMSIPDSASTGMYNLLAYTNCMKSLGSAAMFQGNLLIYNAEKSMFYNVQSESTKKRIQISFENNAIVKGLENTLYYKIEGTIEDTIIVIIKDSNGKILNRKKNKNTLGSIEFTPMEKMKLEFSLQTSDTLFSFSIPEVDDEGINVKLLSGSTSDFKLQIQSTNLHRKLSYNYKLYNKSGELLKSIVLLKENEIITIEKSKFSNGFNSLILKNNNHAVVWERPIKVDKEFNQILIQNLKQNAEEREKLNFSLILENGTDKVKQADVSISVRKVGNSEIDQINKKVDRVESSNLNVLFNYKQELTQSFDNEIYLNEYKGSLLTGRVLNSDGTPLINENIFLCFPDSFVNSQVCKTNMDGEFYFYINNKKVQRDIVINANNGNKNLTILINSNYLNNYSFINKKEIDIRDDYQEHLKELYLNRRIQRVYNQDYSKEYLNSNGRSYSGNFYEEPDEEYYFDDFVMLDSIHEYFYELIKGS